MFSLTKAKAKGVEGIDAVASSAPKVDMTELALDFKRATSSRGQWPTEVYLTLGYLTRPF